MIKFCCFLFILFQSLSAVAGDLPAYKIYKGNGRKASFKKMIRSMQKSDVILFGELHNNPICHWLEFEAAETLLTNDPSIILGAEMFEADNQEALNAYLAGKIGAIGLDSAARLWSNYETDYAQIVDLAKERGAQFIATNIPRRYAGMVYRSGFEVLAELPDREKAWIAPLPIPYDPDLPGYKAMLEMMDMGHGGENFPKAQAVKDATMGHFINLQLGEGQRLFHINGAYHSDNYEGILYYILLSFPDVAFTTVSSVIQEDISDLLDDHIGKADFIICIDSNVTTSY